MSGRLLDWAARIEYGTAFDKAVLLVLAEAANGETGRTWIGQDTIAARARMSVRKVGYVLAALEKAGLIARKKRFLDSGNRTSDLITVRPTARCADGPPARHDIDQLHGVQGNPKENPMFIITSTKGKGYPESFEIAWKAYPHFRGRSDKAKSYTAYARLGGEEQMSLSRAIDAFRTTPTVSNEGGRYVKAFERWIGSGQWRDFVPAATVPTQPEAIDWAFRMAIFRKQGTWLSAWGEKPGRRGCQVPGEMLEEGGFIEADWLAVNAKV
ncbi:helix-turn-helix domain-containing protein [Asticcacaulis solisilvae]|uniref:helix-turn-helix domain-containing protein n=1 Tax=Asticcacaulis solisilvae TaxID=1217274 RepID=UPI003FD7CED9